MKSTVDILSTERIGREAKIDTLAVAARVIWQDQCSSSSGESPEPDDPTKGRVSISLPGGSGGPSRIQVQTRSPEEAEEILSHQKSGLRLSAGLRPPDLPLNKRVYKKRQWQKAEELAEHATVVLDGRAQVLNDSGELVDKD